MNWLGLLGLDTLITRWRDRLNEGAQAAEDRMALAQLEWCDLKSRLQKLVVLVVALGGLTVVALLMLSLALIVHFWETDHREMVAWLVAGAWCAIWAVSVVVLIQTARSASNSFALTRRELAKDWIEIKEHL